MEDASQLSEVIQYRRNLAQKRTAADSSNGNTAHRAEIEEVDPSGHTYVTANVSVLTNLQSRKTVSLPNIHLCSRRS